MPGSYNQSHTVLSGPTCNQAFVQADNGLAGAEVL